MVNGQLSEIRYEDNLWKAWSTVAPPPPAAVTQPPGPTNSTAPDTAPETGLSAGAKAGIGVGVSLGAIALGAIIAAAIIIRRRKQRSQPPQQRPYPDYELPADGPGTPAPPYATPTSQGQYANLTWDKTAYVAPEYPVHQLDATAKPTELYGAPQPVYELPNQTYSHELMAEPPQRLTGQR